MKRGKGYKFFLISILLLSIVTLVISYFDGQETLLAPRVYSQCITPPAYPQMITQSGTICPGTYNYGIGVGADNIALKCSFQTNFRGINWVGKNGLTISGFRNASVEGCEFTNFTGSGVFVGNASSYTAEIKLLKIKSNSNNGDGVFVGHNVVNFHLNYSEIVSNNLDGVVFRANHLGNVTASSTIFPRGIYLDSNNISENHQNGINIDAYDYLDYTLISTPFPTVRRVLSNSILISNNSINKNYKNGIQNTGFTSDGAWPNLITFMILKNKISHNGLQLNGSGLAVISNVSLRRFYSSWPSYGGEQRTFSGWVLSNDIYKNYIDGVSLEVPLNSYNYGPFSYYVSSSNYPILIAYFNYISENGRHGVSFLPDKALNSYSVGIDLLQNKIISNSREGVYSEGNSSIHYSGFSGHFDCNDILLSGNNSYDGLALTGVNALQYLGIKGQNIIENNYRGILIRDFVNINAYPSMYDLLSNYIGSNIFYGLYLFNNQNFTLNVSLNDFDNNALQAYDSNSHLFTHNWWSDYSPTCADTNPADGWCDIPRPIQIANQDVEPKAGAWYGWKNRGYFVRAYPGVVPKPSCYYGGPLPLLPIITVPTFEQPQSPIQTNTGELGNPGSSSSDG